MSFQRILQLLKEYIEWETEFGETPGDAFKFNFEDFKEFIEIVIEFEKEEGREFII